MDAPWEKPDLRNTWEITAISDPRAFMRFVFAAAPAGSHWIVAGTTPEIWDRLARIGELVETHWLGFRTIRHAVIPLTPGNQAPLDRLLAEVKIGLLIEHHVYHGEDLVMCSYDNLSCCWLGKSISYDALKDVARTQGFTIFDPDDPERTRT